MVNMVAPGVVPGYHNSPCRSQGLLKPQTEPTFSTVLLRPQVYFQCREGKPECCLNLLLLCEDLTAHQGARLGPRSVVGERSISIQAFEDTPLKDWLLDPEQPPSDQVTKLTILADSWRSNSEVCYFSSGSHQAYPMWAGRQLGALPLTCSA